jgi:uncharacterized OsmC-like protein
VEAEVEQERHALVIKRIHVRYHLRVDDAADRDAIDRVLRVHARECPIYRSLHPQIEIDTSLDLTTP